MMHFILLLMGSFAGRWFERNKSSWKTWEQLRYVQMGSYVGNMRFHYNCTCQCAFRAYFATERSQKRGENERKSNRIERIFQLSCHRLQRMEPKTITNGRCCRAALLFCLSFSFLSCPESLNKEPYEANRAARLWVRHKFESCSSLNSHKKKKTSWVNKDTQTNHAHYTYS